MTTETTDYLKYAKYIGSIHNYAESGEPWLFNLVAMPKERKKFELLALHSWAYCAIDRSIIAKDDEMYHKSGEVGLYGCPISFGAIWFKRPNQTEKDSLDVKLEAINCLDDGSQARRYGDVIIVGRSNWTEEQWEAQMRVKSDKA